MCAEVPSKHRNDGVAYREAVANDGEDRSARAAVLSKCAEDGSVQAEDRSPFSDDLSVRVWRIGSYGATQFPLGLCRSRFPAVRYD